jgi:hypothetical protein
MRVFVSSTCYDLIDLRAELEKFFQQAGVIPLMSDSITSEFQTSPDRNSIETCLVNVRNCDAFLVILSRRYGRSLKEAGYDDVSATHLEYREAVKYNKRILMFVRDRLEADYATHKRNKGSHIDLPWCDDQQMFGLLDEHRKLTDDKSKNNWLWTFRDSVELKDRLTLEFRDVFASAQAERLLRSGRIPLLEVTAKYKSRHGGNINIDLCIRNLTDITAVRPRLHLDNNDEIHMRSLSRHEEITLPVPWFNTPSSNLRLSMRLSYSIIEGHRFADEGTIFVNWFSSGQLAQEPSITCEVERRRYGGAEALLIPTP